MGTGPARYLLRDIEVRGAFLQRVRLLLYDVLRSLRSEV